MNFFKHLFFALFIVFALPTHIYAELITDKLIADADKKYKTFAKNRFIAIRKELIEGLKNKSDMEKLTAVNDWYNLMQYKSDQEVYGVPDYWATLYEFVGKGMGDCEDYTIAKYYTLKELGIDPHRMKFAYVVYKDRAGRNISHMVLAYLRTEKPTNRNDILILGNINTRVLPASKRPDIVKVVKMINGDTDAQSKKWKELDFDMKRKKL